MNNTSLYIPHVFNNINDERITQIFESKMGFGQISKIDSVSKTGKDGKSYKSVYIHFSKWNDSDKTRAFRKELADNKKATLNYDNPWFWLVLEYKKDTKEKKGMTTPNNSPVIKSVQPPKKKYNSLHEFARDVDLSMRRNLNRECDCDMETRRQMEDVMPIEAMNLVDATYVRYLEQQNAALYNALVYNNNCCGMINKKVDWVYK